MDAHKFLTERDELIDEINCLADCSRRSKSRRVLSIHATKQATAVPIINQLFFCSRLRNWLRRNGRKGEERKQTKIDEDREL